MAKKSSAKTGTKKKGAAKKKTAGKKIAAAAKKSTLKKKSGGKPTIKKILKREFEAWAPKTLFVPQPDTEHEKVFSSPPVFAKKKKDSARLKRLLLKPATLEAVEEKKAEKAPSPKKPVVKKKVSPKAPAAKAKAKKETVPAAKKKPAVSIKTLLMQKFDSETPELPDSPGTGPDENAFFTAPPAIEEADPDRAEGLKALLVKTIDFKSPVEPFPVVEETKADILPEPETAATEVAEPQAEAESVPEAIKEPATEPETAPDTRTEPEPEPESAPEQAMKTMAVPEAEVMGTNIPQPVAQRGCIASGLCSIPGPIKALITFTAVIISLIVIASLLNIRHYYIVPTRTGLEISKGDFTPKGKEDIAFLLLAKAPEKIKDVYTKSEVYAIIYWHYIKKAGALARSTNLSDLKNAKKYIDNARAYALSSEDFDRVKTQLNRINAKIKAIAPATGKKMGKE
ncbi:MAG: hypothetical protein GXP53_04960 [Deltaproteobacteria bacterium]|nr:hypothetical protein [Deltaproteobacteria bacterium]